MTGDHPKRDKDPSVPLLNSQRDGASKHSPLTTFNSCIICLTLSFTPAANNPRMDWTNRTTPKKSNSTTSATIQHPQTNQPAAAIAGPHQATDFTPADIEMSRDIFMSVSLQMEEVGKVCYYWSMECYPNLQRIDAVLHHGYEGPIEVAKFLLCNDTGKLHEYPGCQEIIDKICTMITQTREADPTVCAISTDALKSTRYYCRVGVCKFLLHNSEPSRAERAIINSEYRIALTQHSMRQTVRNQEFMSLPAFTELTMRNKLKYMIGYDYTISWTMCLVNMEPRKYCLHKMNMSLLPS
jgi:hypothetical protein